MADFALVAEFRARLPPNMNRVGTTASAVSSAPKDLGDGSHLLSGKRWLAPAMVIISMLVLAALGLWTISRSPFWLDEASTILAARRSFERMFDAYGPNQAFYTLVLHFWRLIGESELRLRFLSVACAVATVPALYLLGLKLLGKRAALAACFMFATNAYVVAYMQTVRPYTLLLLLLVAATLLYLDAMKRNSWTLWTLYGITMAAALWTNFFAGFVLLAHLVGFFTRRPRSQVLPAIPAIALTMAAAVPIGLFVVSRGKESDGWILPTTPAVVWDAAVQVSGGGPLRLVITAGLVVVGMAAVGLTVKRWSFGLLVAWVIFPFVGVLLISLLTPIFLSRYVLLTAPAIALLAGSGLARLQPWPAALVITAVVLASGPTLVDHYGLPYDDWRGAAAYVATHAQAGDRIVFDDPPGERPFVIYLERNRHAPLVTVRAAEASPARRVWLVFWRRGYAETTAIRNGMGKYKAIVNEAYGGVHVQLAVPR